MRAEGYDVIGDVHGHAGELRALLVRLGYQERDGVHRHSTRQAVFVGDLIDRGPEQLETVAIARAMLHAGAAHIVMGNHEFNAIAFHTPDPHEPGAFLRRHTTKNLGQHGAFLDQVGPFSPAHDELIEWFATLPLWFEVDGLRVIHACWDPKAMELLGSALGEGRTLTRELVVAASTEGAPEYDAVEHLLKGPEIPLDVPYVDKGGIERWHARFRWWLEKADRLPVAAHLPNSARMPDGQPYPPLENRKIDPPVPPYREPIPVLYGHYWASGELRITSDHTACVDYSAGRGGPLVAYRWSGESEVAAENLVASRK